MCIRDSIKIGLMAPITGAFASEGQDMQKICELMTEELNKAGGINGNKVQDVYKRQPENCSASRKC